MHYEMNKHHKKMARIAIDKINEADIKDFADKTKAMPYGFKSFLDEE